MTVLSFFVVFFSVFLFLLAGITLILMLYGWRRHEAWPAIAVPAEPGHLSFTLMVPAREEEAVLAGTLERLAHLDHPRYHVVVIVGDDDPATHAVADAAAAQYPGLFRVVVDVGGPKSKPKALNTALKTCTTDVIGVFDAEDVVHPRILQVIEERMVADGAAAVQSGVLLVNFWSRWFTCRNSLEYYFWFRSRLGFQADYGFIPLGGNTVFVRRSIVEHLGGWDAGCLAEDCDLGVRLSSHGLPISVVYDPEIVTREEAPVTVGAFVRQRTRWNQGFIQVMRKAEWTLLPRRSRILALFTLATPFLLATTGLLVPIAIVLAVLVQLPVPIVLVSFLPWVPALISILMELLALGDVARMAHRRARLGDYLRLVVSTPVYQVLLAFCAVRACVRAVAGDNRWEKTEHIGVHLVSEPVRQAVA